MFENLKKGVFFPFVYTYVLVLFLSACSSPVSPQADWQWQQINAKGKPTARHEAGLVAYGSKLYLMGGRRINPTDVFDIKSSSWQEKAKSPLEIHHFQAVVVEDAIYIVGAMTGGWPNETPLDKVLIYYPKQDRYEFSHAIPESRRRGGAGAVYHNDKIYLIGGITNGHMDGAQAWFDEYDPKTGEWRILPDAPSQRDHFHAVVNDNRLYAFAGRTTSRGTGQDIDLTVSVGDKYNFSSGRWQALDKAELKTGRAGNSAFSWQDKVVVLGGESMSQQAAHSEVAAFDVNSQTWQPWPDLLQGRHGSGVAVVDGYVYAVSGCGQRGGEPELSTIERLHLP